VSRLALLKALDLAAMKQSSADSESSPRAFVRWPLWVLAAALVAVVFKLGHRPQAPQATATAVSSPPATKLPREESRILKTSAPDTPAPAVPPATVEAATPPPSEPGHEGHGDECAHCFGEKRLAACREDYARLCYSQVTQEYVIDEGKSPQVLDACRRFASSVLKEWSHSGSRPVLPPDEIVEARRREIIGPLLRGLSARQE